MKYFILAMFLQIPFTLAADLEMYELVDISKAKKITSHTLQYPGLGNEEDCIAIHLGPKVDHIKARAIADRITVHDRASTELPVTIHLSRNNTVLLYKIEDLGKYLTVLRILAKSAYEDIGQIFSNTTALMQRLPFCEGRN